ncbi:MAG: PAS domain-containing protein [Bacteroidetes bacterium]|nr:PAS domain-containing protein [Bacteroidota bacterium]
MTPMEVSVPGRSIQLKYYEGFQRTIICTDRETPFPEGTLIVSRTDTAGIITHCNKSFCDIAGYSKEELIGEYHSILRHPDMPAIAFKGLWDTIQQGKRWHGYVKNLRKDGGFYWVFASVIPNVREGKIVGYTSVRRKPSRTRIQECEVLYKKLLEEEKK